MKSIECYELIYVMDYTLACVISFIYVWHAVEDMIGYNLRLDYTYWA